MVVRRQDVAPLAAPGVVSHLSHLGKVRACDVGSRVLEAKNQARLESPCDELHTALAKERETLSRCRWAEYQA